MAKVLGEKVGVWLVYRKDGLWYNLSKTNFSLAERLKATVDNCWHVDFMQNVDLSLEQ